MGPCSLPVIYLGPNYGGRNEDNGDLLQKVHMHARLHSVPPTLLQVTAHPHLHQRHGKDIERWTPRFVGAQYDTGKEWRNNARKNEEMEPKQKQYTAVDVTGDGSQVWCCKSNLP